MTGVSKAQTVESASSLFKSKVTMEEISVQRMRKLAKREPVFLAVVRMKEENEEPRNESIVTMNEDQSKTAYPV